MLLMTWDKCFIMKQTQNIAELNYQNLITPVTKYGLFPLQLNHPDVCLFFSESLSARNSGADSREEIMLTDSMALFLEPWSPCPQNHCSEAAQVVIVAEGELVITILRRRLWKPNNAVKYIWISLSSHRQMEGGGAKLFCILSVSATPRHTSEL